MKGNIPVLMVTGKCLAEAWEKSLIELWEKGCDIRTDYDTRQGDGKFIDPPSRDASMCIVVEEPLSEPMIHRCFPGSLEDLEEYRMEVVEGIKDHWIRDPSDPNDKRWEYTYHRRLFAYEEKGGGNVIDQIDDVIISKLICSPFSRRANAITWQPWIDKDIEHPPCLQSIWCRIVKGGDGIWYLNMNVRFRSRDAYDAAFMNMFALVSLQEYIAKRISDRTGEEVRLGRYVDWSDSYHIYGRRFESFRDGFLKIVEKRRFEDRTWTRQFAQPFFEEARAKIAEKIERYDRKN
jgi:thymidylate synthase